MVSGPSFFLTPHRLVFFFFLYGQFVCLAVLSLFFLIAPFPLLILILCEGSLFSAPPFSFHFFSGNSGILCGVASVPFFFLVFSFSCNAKHCLQTVSSPRNLLNYLRFYPVFWLSIAHFSHPSFFCFVFFRRENSLLAHPHKKPNHILYESKPVPIAFLLKPYCPPLGLVFFAPNTPIFSSLCFFMPPSFFEFGSFSYPINILRPAD